MIEHVFIVKTLALKDKQEGNVLEVKLEMNVNDAEDLAFVSELLHLKQNGLVQVGFEPLQKALPLSEER